MLQATDEFLSWVEARPNIQSGLEALVNSSQRAAEQQLQRARGLAAWLLPADGQPSEAVLEQSALWEEVRGPRRAALHAHADVSCASCRHTAAMPPQPLPELPPPPTTTPSDCAALLMQIYAAGIAHSPAAQVFAGAIYPAVLAPFRSHLFRCVGAAAASRRPSTCCAAVVLSPPACRPTHAVPQGCWPRQTGWVGGVLHPWLCRCRA